jgi:hypothetical protein
MNGEIFIFFYSKYFFQEFLRSIKITYVGYDFYYARMNIFILFF